MDLGRHVPRVRAFTVDDVTQKLADGDRCLSIDAQVSDLYQPSSAQERVDFRLSSFLPPQVWSYTSSGSSVRRANANDGSLGAPGRTGVTTCSVRSIGPRVKPSRIALLRKA